MNWGYVDEDRYYEAMRERLEAVAGEPWVEKGWYFYGDHEEDVAEYGDPCEWDEDDMIEIVARYDRVDGKVISARLDRDAIVYEYAVGR